MFTQSQVTPRIVLVEDQQFTNSELKLKIAFLNQEITSDPKNGYFKLLIWLVGNHDVEDFVFKLFLKVNGSQVLLPVEDFLPNFHPNNQNYLVVKIPGTIFDPDFNELAYTFTHNQFLTGQGRIFLYLKNPVKNIINNELLFYENQKSFSLVTRTWKWVRPEFYYFQQRYKELGVLNYQTLDESYLAQLEPVRRMGSLVKNNTWIKPLEILGLQIEAEGDDVTKKYRFEPGWQINPEKNHFEINFLNHLVLNQDEVVVEGGDEPGFLFNPSVGTRQTVRVKLKLFNSVQELSFQVRLPKISYERQSEGQWNAV